MINLRSYYGDEDVGWMSLMVGHQTKKKNTPTSLYKTKIKYNEREEGDKIKNKKRDILPHE